MSILSPNVFVAAGSHSQHQKSASSDGNRSLDRIAPDTANSNCASCTELRDVIRNMTLEDIKQSILNKLGLKQAPNISGLAVPKIPTELPPVKQLLKLYDADERPPPHPLRHKHRESLHMLNDQPFRPGHITNDEEDDFHLTSQSVIAIAKPCTTQCQRNRGHFPMFFSFEEKTAHSTLSSAKLMVYQKVPKHAEIDQRVTITVFKLNPRNNTSQQYIEIYSTEETLTPSGKWIAMNLRQQLSEHFRENDVTNLSLIIHATYTADNMTSVKVPLSTDVRKIDNDNQVPYLEIQAEDTRKMRTKRQAGLVCKEDSDEKRCCRYPLTVDFEQFKWDFIIAPKRYEANYCAGECPYVFLQRYPHTHIFQMANKSANIGPCCAPRKLSAITMLYFDAKGNIIYGVLPGMVVDRCGCS